MHIYIYSYTYIHTCHIYLDLVNTKIFPKQISNIIASGIPWDRTYMYTYMYIGIRMYVLMYMHI
jgi:hypothetical protein